jgi:acetolactate synthase-1/2/3 large subunit
MPIFNAWCDRMPVIVLGATGPMDAARRRPWIEWIHTAQDQGAIVRPYVKWDAQPSSPAAAREALFRASWIAGTAPMGPVYVNLDLGLQEDSLPGPLPAADPKKLMPRMTPGAPERLVAEALAMLEEAERPVILMGRVSRKETAWAARLDPRPGRHRPEGRRGVSHRSSTTRRQPRHLSDAGGIASHRPGRRDPQSGLG